MTLYVNAEKIDEKHIQAEVEKLRPDYERVFADKPEPQRQKQLYEWSRENVIEAVLLRQVARKNQKDISPEAVNKAYEQLAKQTVGKSDDEEQVKKEIAERMRIERLISKITGNIKQPSDKDIRKYFQKNADRFTIAEMVRASHIVMHQKTDVEDKNIKEKMQQILKELRDGADFGDMARKHSDCPENAGDLGFFPRGSMVQGFEDIVFGMEAGQTSDVFKTEFGYHIAKVTDKRPATPCRLEDVREVIVRELTAQARQKALEKFIDAQKAKAVIEEK
ncbi:MAG: peptidylprolyl isomerase [Planctomycetota bacterium]|jgi:parvulin-like peptidyl-prolyl isomerase